MPFLTTAARPTPPLEGKAADVPADPDDELLALLYVGTWTLRTGRVLPVGVPAHQLSEAELIEFWADDRLEELEETGPPPSDQPRARRH